MTLYNQALDELGQVFARLDEAEVDALCAAIAGAGRITVAGRGRERLQLMGLAMRLFHMGLAVAVDGDVTAPPLGPGDLLVATCGPGELPTIGTLAALAQAAGARVAVITAQPRGPVPMAADLVLTLPAQTMADDRGPARRSVLPMGSAFEGALFVLFEVMVLKLMDRLAIDPDAMRARHTNLE